MADNVAITGATVASDDVGGVQYQRVKLDGGGDGVTTPLISTIVPPLSNATALPTREVGQTTWSSGFSLTQATLGAEWQELLLGPGMGRLQASSNLVITSGTTATSEFLARSVTLFSGALLMRVRATLSQRIINQNFTVLLADTLGDSLAYTSVGTVVTVTLTGHGLTTANIGQSIFVGAIAATSGNGVPGRYAIADVPTANTLTLTVAGWTDGVGTLSLFGRSFARLLYQGTVATNMQFDVGNAGWSDTPVTATSTTTAGTGHQAQIHLDGRNAYLADSAVASSTSPLLNSRASRYEFVPADTTRMALYIWAYNGTTAPASSTAWNLGAVSIETFSNLPVYVAGQRQQGQAAAAPVAVVGNVATTAGTSALLMGDVAIQYRATATGGASIRHVVSAATTNAASVKAAAGRLLGWSLANTSASFKFVKFHNTAGTPTAGAAIVQTVAIPPSSHVALTLAGGVGYATGIGMTITGASPDADTTAVAVGDVIGDIYFA